MPDSSSILCLRGARVVLPDRVTGPANLIVQDGQIQSITEGSPEREAQKPSLDLAGLTVFPGFIDFHIHGAVGIDTMEADADGLHSVARFLAQHGVTGWLPTLVPAPQKDYASSVGAVTQLMVEQNERPPAARAFGFHYEGPFINSAQCGALRARHFRIFKGSEVDELPVGTYANAVRMTTVAPEIEGGIALVKELKHRGWIVSIGHTRASVEVLEQALQAGARHMTHFMNAMLPLHHRAPGPIGWGLLRDEVTCDLIADGVHIDPILLQVIVRCKSAGRISLISDSIAPTGVGDGAYTVWGETIKVLQGRTSNERGSIAGSVITMLDAVRMMLSLNFPVTDVARMAAFNPAQLIGKDQECGSITEGKRADLVALDDQGNVRLTLVGGQVAFNSL
jgi:N-acetylglucosamine-6-phosphate deacetylase